MPELGCDDELFTVSFDRCSNKLFGMSLSILDGRIDEVDSLVEYMAKIRHEVSIGGSDPATRLPGTDTKPGNLDICSPKSRVFNVSHKLTPIPQSRAPHQPV